jgi:hypothetical protein
MSINWSHGPADIERGQSESERILGLGVYMVVWG